MLETSPHSERCDRGRRCMRACFVDQREEPGSTGELTVLIARRPD